MKACAVLRLRLLILLFALWPGLLRAEGAPLVAAASDLKFALDEIAAGFRADTGGEVDIVYGSTGNFTTQIREGAPFEVFMAADESFVQTLNDEGLTQGEGVVYGHGRLALVVPKGGVLRADPGLVGLRDVLAAGGITRFAIANPEHAPYGKRAVEALERSGLWDALQPFVIYGENVAQAAQFALSGEAEGGIVAYALALAPAVQDQSDHALLPADWHSPLVQRMVLLNGASAGAEAFYAYLQGPKAQDILRRFGFFPDGAG
jgi:molybdate transport system substrate-binding protein